MYSQTQNNTYTKTNLRSVKWAQWDKTQSRELLGLFICVCSSLCTIVVHITAQNRPDNFPSCPPDNHHCSDDVYLRERGETIHVMKQGNRGQQTSTHARNLPVPPGESRWIICYIEDSKPVSLFGPSRENMMSCTKMKVHNALQCHQRRTKPWPQITCTETHTRTQPFYGPIYGTTRVSQRQKSFSGLHGAREDNIGRCTNRHHPPFLHWMPLLRQPSHFIPAWDRHQICWLTHPLVWLVTCTENFMKVFSDMHMNRQTERHTNIRIEIFCTPPAGKVITSNNHWNSNATSQPQKATSSDRWQINSPYAMLTVNTTQHAKLCIFLYWEQSTTCCQSHSANAAWKVMARDDALLTLVNSVAKNRDPKQKFWYLKYSSCMLITGTKFYKMWSMPHKLWPTSGIRMYIIIILLLRYGDGAGNTVEENSSIFSLIRLR